MKIYCYDCKDTTSHKTKYLGGEKEFYYSTKCRKCGKEKLVPTYEIRRIKEGYV